MGEAVLALHRAGERMFELSRLRTGSVRDQILRATLLVDALISRRWVRQGDVNHGLLVIGGGVAGCTAALRASSRRVHVTLLEPLVPMHTQQSAANRWIDPVEYDWPQPHWRDGCFPVLHQGVAPRPRPLFQFQADHADALGTAWQLALADWIARQAGHNGRGRLDIVPRTGNAASLSLQSTPPDAPHLQWRDARPGDRARYGAAVACTGIGEEDVGVAGSSFRGREFWGGDQLDDLRRLPKGGPRKRVLVSGGGDGAQQDFLRACTGDFGKRLHDQLGVSLDDTDRFDLLAIEDECRRAHAWAQQPRGVPSDLMQRWHARYLQVADRVWHRWQLQGLLAHGVDQLLPTDVTWVLRSSHPSHCYGLNRLLVILVARLVNSRDSHRPWSTHWLNQPDDPDAVIRSRCTVTAVACQHTPVSTGQPAALDPCFDQPHQVTLAPGGPQLFDVVVLRHGLRNPKAFFGRGAAINEQLVPYSLP